MIVLFAVIGASLVAAVMSGFLPNPVVAGDPKAKGHDTRNGSQSAITVKVVKPRNDPSVQLTVEQLGTVEAYNQVEFRPRVTGYVKGIYKNIGDPVRQGELLLEIDVPDLHQDVAQKEAIVRQRQQELRVSEANLRNAEVGRQVAKAAIHEKHALVEQAEATRDFRRKRLDRMLRLAASDSVVAGIIDEEERDTKASEAAVSAALAAVEKSKADALEAESKIEAAKADTDLKAALVEVARRDVERARTVAEFARIYAPFDGEVVDVGEAVDLGLPVINGSDIPLMTVARRDLVTLVARFTDAAAPFITEGTHAEMLLNNGVTVGGTVTRFSPSIQNKDRTMRVEVDLFNGIEEDHKRLILQLQSASLAPLCAADPLGLVARAIAGKNMLSSLQKADADDFPLSAPLSAALPRTRLLPGMTGTMKLYLTNFRSGYVLPSTAVYSRSGTPYVLVVEDGVTKQKPVQVQVNDGRVAKIVFVSRRRDAAGMFHEEITELTGNEMIVAGRQLEIGEGQQVNANIHNW